MPLPVIRVKSIGVITRVVKKQTNDVQLISMLRKDDVELTVESWKCRKEARGFPQRGLGRWNDWVSGAEQQM